MNADGPSADAGAAAEDDDDEDRPAENILRSDNQFITLPSVLGAVSP